MAGGDRTGLPRCHWHPQEIIDCDLSGIREVGEPFFQEVGLLQLPTIGQLQNSGGNEQIVWMLKGVAGFSFGRPSRKSQSVRSASKRKSRCRRVRDKPMIEMLATLLIVIAAPKGEMRMEFYMPTMEQCKQVEPPLCSTSPGFVVSLSMGAGPIKTRGGHERAHRIPSATHTACMNVVT